MKHDVCGLPVDILSTQQVIDRVVSWTGENPLTVFSCNVDMVVKAHRDPSFAKTLAGATLLTADGMPIVWLGRMLGGDFPERVAGSDLVPRIAQAAAGAGRSIFLFGGEPGVAERAAARLQGMSRGLRIAGTYSPPMGFDAVPELRAEAIRRVREAAPDILFVAMGAPRQERFILGAAEELGAKAILGIGGSLDMLGGNVRRAPDVIQRSGLEWLWRLAQEPRRLARRYLVDDAAFAPIAARALVASFRRR